MALIQLNLIEQGSTPIQKKEIVSNPPTVAMAPFEGKNMRCVSWATIEEICSLEWSIGGPARSTRAVPDSAAGKNKIKTHVEEI